MRVAFKDVIKGDSLIGRQGSVWDVISVQIDISRIILRSITQGRDLDLSEHSFNRMKFNRDVKGRR